MSAVHTKYPVRHDGMLDIVDDNDVIIGQALRSDIHDKGLMHREVHVWFVTQDGHIIFQKRADDKDTYPGLLDATVGGHVEIGDDYPMSAIKEAQEEAGVALTQGDLMALDKFKNISFDDVTQRHNNCFRMIYGYVFKGDVRALKIEEQQGTGFVTRPIASVIAKDPDACKDVIDGLLSPAYIGYYKKLAALVGAQ